MKYWQRLRHEEHGDTLSDFFHKENWDSANPQRQERFVVVRAEGQGFRVMAKGYGAFGG